jgi:sulfite reductase (ferredoxin)
MNEFPVTFPATAIPPEASHARLLGLGAQRQEGLWMQRVRIAGGRLTSEQWLALARISRELTPGEPLHLTTRQDMEIHGLTDQTVPQAQRALAEAGLTGLGGGGDSIRNVTVCPCSGVAPGSPDLLGLAGTLTETLQSQPDAFSLPRKFKVSLSACSDAYGLPWINDIGLVAHANGEGWSFQARVAGSLGHTPGLGVAWPDALGPGEAPAFVLAGMRILASHGDREHRSRARLRHVRERMGDGAFLELLRDRFDQARSQVGLADVSLEAPAPGLTHRRRVVAPGGNLSPEVAETFARLAAREDMRVRLGLHHEVWLFASDPEPLDKALRSLPPECSNTPTIVACPGVRWCSKGLVDSQAMAQRLRETLAGLPSDTWIAISGCPNNCAHSAIADVGLIGRLAGGAQAYRVLVGGDARTEPRLGRESHDKVLSEQVPEIVRAQIALE